MSLNRLNGKSFFSLSVLLVVLSSARVFSAVPREKYVVQDIFFGIIEPPVVAQKDITVRAPMSNQQTEPCPLECSGLAWLDGYLLIASDRHEHLIFTCPVDLENMVIGTPQHHVLIHNEQFLLNDAESLTLFVHNDTTLLYVICSMSNAPDTQPLPARRHLLCCNINQIGPFKTGPVKVFPAEFIRKQLQTCFGTIKARPYYTFNAEFPGQDKNTYRWGNLEGFTFTPDEKYLLCGLRNPLYDGAAIVFAVSGIPGPTQSMQTEFLKLTDFFLLDLQDRGVSDIAWDPVTQGYLITAAKSNGPRLDADIAFPPSTLDSALFWWSGDKKDIPILAARFPDMTMEAVCRLGMSRYIALGSDEGDVSEGRTARQSIVTVMEFTGVRREGE